MTDYREELARQIREAAGQHNDDALPVVHVVAKMREEIGEYRKLAPAIREFLWLAVCWNDHNFEDGAVAMKCRELSLELGISSVDEANDLMDRLEASELTKGTHPRSKLGAVCPACLGTGCPFPEHRWRCGIHHCPHCKPGSEQGSDQ